MDRTKATLWDLIVGLIAILVGYALRHHLVSGILLAILICLLGIGGIELAQQKRRHPIDGNAWLRGALKKAKRQRDKDRRRGIPPAVLTIPTSSDAPTLRPASIESIKKAVEDAVWSAQRYRSESEWNVKEGRAFLILTRRDSDLQAFRITVTDPTNFVSTHEFTQSGSKIQDIYPDQFEYAPHPLVSGDYRVEWEAMVEDENHKPYMGKVDESAFRKPY